MKTIRFTEVVEQCGRPHAHALWVAPDDDPEFLRARKADRVMTVEPTPGGKADVGKVGFAPDPEKGNLFLIFPRSLKAFHGTRIIGIKFDLVDQPATLTPKEHEVWTNTGRRKKSPSRTGSRFGARSPSPKSHDGNGDDLTASEASPHADVSPHAPRRRTRPPNSLRAASIAHPRHRSTHRPSLVQEVRAALAELRAGNALAAYQRLDRALRDSHGS